MKKKTYNIEGLELEVIIDDKKNREMDQERRLFSYLIKAIREYSGMDRASFCEWLGIPYRTLQEWELGGRMMPDYVLRLIAYKVRMEKLSGNI